VDSSADGGDSAWVDPADPAPQRNPYPQGSAPREMRPLPAEPPTGPWPAEHELAVPEPGRSAPAVSAESGAASAWHAFTDWRRSRPFWGGLLLLLAGLELLGIPLLSVLAYGQVKVVIYIGIGGIFGVLIGGPLVACGLLVWFHPAQRTFYAVAGVLLAVLSFVATNLGGFFAGMLLGVTGASLSFGWTVATANASGQHRPQSRGDGPQAGLGLLRPGTEGREPGRGR
jgi:Family of unknown function (DUF6114)